MKQQLETILGLIKDHGLPLTAFAMIIAWFFYLDWNNRKIIIEERRIMFENYVEMRREVQTLRLEVLTCYREEREKLRETIDRNSKVMEDFLNRQNTK